MAVEYEELEGSPKLKITKEGQSAQRVLRVAWDDIDDFVSETFGIIYGAGETTVRQPPVPFPGKPWLFPESIDIEPMDGENPRGTGPDGSCSYPHAGARVTVGYKTLDFEDDDEPYLSIRTSVGAEFLTLPKAGLKWDVTVDGLTSVSDEVAAGLLVPTIEHQLTLHRVAVVPWDSIRAAIGRVNSSVYSGVPAECLLFCGCELSREVGLEGAKHWQIDYRFSERVVIDTNGDIAGWNHFYREAGASSGFYRLETAAGDPIYRLASFAGLI